MVNKKVCKIPLQKSRFWWLQHGHIEQQCVKQYLHIHSGGQDRLLQAKVPGRTGYGHFGKPNAEAQILPHLLRSEALLRRKEVAQYDYGPSKSIRVRRYWHAEIITNILTIDWILEIISKFIWNSSEKRRHSLYCWVWSSEMYQKKNRLIIYWNPPNENDPLLCRKVLSRI